MKENIIDLLKVKKDKILNSKLAFDILNFINNKDEIIKNQERFRVDSIAKMNRLDELLGIYYTESNLILRTLDDSEMNYLTIIKVNERGDFHIKLDLLLRGILGNNYEVTLEKFTFPQSLSFSNNENTLHLLNYDSGTIEF